MNRAINDLIEKANQQKKSLIALKSRSKKHVIGVKGFIQQLQKDLQECQRDIQDANKEVSEFTKNIAEYDKMIRLSDETIYRLRNIR